ncbi:MAG: 2-C-methyl-D-erythritol 4-phosphate cytidylyltransferase [Ferruginibacter sp.]|nr:2-C-methyl-D-erythritol 4-phosphate cytidylyltransferase [Cytophagales bacterium]
MKRYAIIVAGGIGSRMRENGTLPGDPVAVSIGHNAPPTGLPKQFLCVGGLPILMQTIRRFAESVDGSLFGTPTVVVLSRVEFPTWERLCREHHFDTPVQLVAGGSTRFESVRNGLRVLGSDGLVAIHDGVRPFVSTDLIERSFRVAAEKGSAVAAVPVKDSIRLVEGDRNRAVDRRQVRLIQTPQTFQLSLIQQAFRQAADRAEDPSDFSDDASVAERAGFPIHLIEGSYDNIKITTPEDLLWAEAFLKKFI